MSLFIEIIML